MTTYAIGTRTIGGIGRRQTAASAAAAPPAKISTRSDDVADDGLGPRSTRPMCRRRSAMSVPAGRAEPAAHRVEQPFLADGGRVGQPGDEHDRGRDAHDRRRAEPSPEEHVDDGDEPEGERDLLQHHRDGDRQAGEQEPFMDQQVQREHEEEAQRYLHPDEPRVRREEGVERRPACDPTRADPTPRSSRPMRYTSRTVRSPNTSVVDRMISSVGPPTAVRAATK